VFFLAGRIPEGECPLHEKGGLAGKIIKGVKELIDGD
jgi:hypothetical protein